MERGSAERVRAFRLPADDRAGPGRETSDGADDHPPVDLIVRALAARPEQPIAADQLAARALAMDEGMARAVFGPPPAPGEMWTIRATTRFQLKAGLYDVGILDSPLATNTSGAQGAGGYDPGQDFWLLGAACR